MAVDPWTEEFEISVAANDKTVVQLETIELHHSAFVEAGTRIAIRVVNDTADQVLRLEADAPLQAGQDVTWTAVPFTWSPPDVAEGQAPQAQIQVDNTEKLLEPYLDAMEESFEPLVVIYRMYLSNRRTVVEMGPFRFTLKDVSSNNGSVGGTVTIATSQNIKFGTRIYDADNFASLIQTS
jgi:hypothetical protein